MEVSTYKEVVELFWGELSVTPTFFSLVVSPGRMYDNISIYWWIYFSSRSLVWGIIFSCAGYVGGYSYLWIEESCVRDSMSYVSVGVMYWYISVVFGILLEVGDV